MPPTVHHDPLHVGGKPSEGAAATATHTQEERIAQCLTQSTADAADMAHGIHKEDQLQLGCVDLVIVLMYSSITCIIWEQGGGGEGQVILCRGVLQSLTWPCSDPEMVSD